MRSVKFIILIILSLQFISCDILKSKTNNVENTTKLYEVKGLTKYTKIAKDVEKRIIEENKNADKSTIRYSQYKAIREDQDCDLTTEEIQNILNTLK